MVLLPSIIITSVLKSKWLSWQKRKPNAFFHFCFKNIQAHAVHGIFQTRKFAVTTVPKVALNGYYFIDYLLYISFIYITQHRTESRVSFRVAMCCAHTTAGGYIEANKF